MRNIISLIFILNMAISYAQINLEWANSTNTNAISNLQSDMFLDNSKNIYSIGYFDGTKDFNPGAGTFYMTTDNTADLYIQKLDSNGNFIKAVQIGDSAFLTYHKSFVDGEGFIYLSLSFLKSLDADPGPNDSLVFSEANYNNWLILKIDPLFNLIFVVNLSNSSGNGLVVTENKDIILTGGFRDTVDFDPGLDTFNLISPYPNNIASRVIYKLDSLGNFIFAKQFESFENTLNLTSIEVDNSGNFYVDAYFKDSVDIDPELTSQILYNPNHTRAICKFNNSGNLIWVYTYEHFPHYYYVSMDSDSLNNLYILGINSWNTDYDMGSGVSMSTNPMQNDYYILKLDSSGSFMWVKFIDVDAPGSGLNLDLYSKPNGDILIAGYAKNFTDFNPNINETYCDYSSSNFLFLEKLDANGEFIWMRKFQNASGLGGNIIECRENEIYFTGKYLGLVDIDPGPDNYMLNSGGVTQKFLIKFNECTNSTLSYLNDTICQGDSILLGNTYYGSIGNYAGILSNSQGCDSVISMQLFVRPEFSDSTYQTICNGDSILFQGTYLTSAGNYNFIYSDIHGCDSISKIYINVTYVPIGVTTSGTGLMVLTNNATYQWLDCSTGDPIPGETNQYFYPQSNGQFAVEVTINGCSNISSCYNFSTFGINQYELNSINIYPNPASTEIHLKLNNSEVVNNIDLIDLTGKIINTIPVYKITNELKLPLELPSGYYFIRLNLENKSLLNKLVIQN